MKLDLLTLTTVRVDQMTPGTIFKPVMRDGASKTCVLLDGGDQMAGQRVFMALTGENAFHAWALARSPNLLGIRLLDGRSARVALDDLRFDRNADAPGTLLLDATGPMLRANLLGAQGFFDAILIDLQNWTCEGDLMRTVEAVRITEWALVDDGDPAETIFRVQPPVAG